MSDTNFTPEYFLNELSEFRKLLGDKRFWDKGEEAEDTAVKAITFCYFNTKAPTKEEEAKIQQSYKVTMEEYTRRKTMILQLKLRKLAA